MTGSMSSQGALLVLLLLALVATGALAQQQSVLREFGSEEEQGDRSQGSQGEQQQLDCPIRCFKTDPICGTDGLQYWCGAKEARCNGAEVAFRGFCAIGGGSGGKGVLAGQALLLVHLVWLILAAAMVVMGMP